MFVPCPYTTKYLTSAVIDIFVQSYYHNDIYLNFEKFGLNIITILIWVLREL